MIQSSIISSPTLHCFFYKKHFFVKITSLIFGVNFGKIGEDYVSRFYYPGNDSESREKLFKRHSPKEQARNRRSGGPLYKFRKTRKNSYV